MCFPHQPGVGTASGPRPPSRPPRSSPASSRPRRCSDSSHNGVRLCHQRAGQYARWASPPRSRLQEAARTGLRDGPSQGRMLSLASARRMGHLRDLVWGQLAGALASTVALWTVVRWRPGWRGSWRTARAMLGYGGKIVSVNVVAAIVYNAEFVIVGRLLGSAALGLYGLAYRVPELIITMVVWVVGTVTFPLYSKLREDQPALRRAYLVTLRYLSLVSLPGRGGPGDARRPFRRRVLWAGVGARECGVAGAGGSRRPSRARLRMRRCVQGNRAAGHSPEARIAACGRSRPSYDLGRQLRHLWRRWSNWR